MNTIFLLAQIVFTCDELPPKEIQDHYDSLMVVALVNGNFIF